MKHLINRLVDCANKSNIFYGQFTKALHRAFTDSGDKPVTSRTGAHYIIKDKLDDPELIILKVEKCISNYKDYPGLFRSEFNATWELQKDQIKLFLIDCEHEGKS